MLPPPDDPDKVADQLENAAMSEDGEINQLLRKSIDTDTEEAIPLYT